MPRRLIRLRIILLLILLILIALFLQFHPTHPLPPGLLLQKYHDAAGLTSLETTVAKADGIYLVSVARIDIAGPPAPDLELVNMGMFIDPSGVRTWVTFDVKERFKGLAAKTLGPFPVPVGSYQFQPNIDSYKGDLLLILKHPPDENQLIELDSQCSIMSLDQDVFTTYSELLPVLRRIGPLTATRFGLIPVFNGTYFHGGVDSTGLSRDKVWSGDHWLNLNVPLDARLESLARSWLTSSDLHLRYSAIRALGFFPSRDNAALLRQFLQSPDSKIGAFEQPNSDLSPWTGARYYPFRIAAAASLGKMGYPVSNADLSDPPHPYHVGWPIALVVLAPLFLWFLLRRIPILRPRILRLAALSVIISVVLAGLVVHSYYRGHFFATTAFSTYHDLTLYRGNLHYEILRDFPFICPPSYACAPLAKPSSSLFAEDGPGFRPWHNFNTEPGIVFGELQSIPGFAEGPMETNFSYPETDYYPTHVIALPAWPAPLIALLPALLALPCFIRHLRRRYRLRRNLCPTCAYNLQAHNPGDKCPECGSIVPGLTILTT